METLPIATLIAGLALVGSAGCADAAETRRYVVAYEMGEDAIFQRELAMEFVDGVPRISIPGHEDELAIATNEDDTHYVFEATSEYDIAEVGRGQITLRLRIAKRRLDQRTFPAEATVVAQGEERTVPVSLFRIDAEAGDGEREAEDE